MTQQIVLASGNRGKLREFNDILNPEGIEIHAQGEFDVPEAEETGLTFVENAILKARNACKYTGLPAIADDSGLEIDFLRGEPGIYSARFAGPDATDSTNIEKLLGLLSSVPEKKRSARFQCVLVCMRHELDPTPLICAGTWEGRVLEVPTGSGGFGYDPIFWSPEFQCAAAELTPDQKRAVSHRGKAVQALTEQLTRFLNQS